MPSLLSSSVSVQSRSGLLVHLSANVAPVLIVMFPGSLHCWEIIARGYLNINPVSQSATIHRMPLAVAGWPPVVILCDS